LKGKPGQPRLGELTGFRVEVTKGLVTPVIPLSARRMVNWEQAVSKK
jgi:hypothetical protein